MDRFKEPASLTEDDFEIPQEHLDQLNAMAKARIALEAALTRFDAANNIAFDPEDHLALMQDLNDVHYDSFEDIAGAFPESDLDVRHEIEQEYTRIEKYFRSPGYRLKEAMKAVTT